VVAPAYPNDSFLSGDFGPNSWGWAYSTLPGRSRNGVL